MIKEILELLAITNSRANVVQLAKGLNKYPESVKELIKRQKQERLWLRK